MALDPRLVRPTYDSASFAAIPSSVAGLLGRGPGTSLAEELSAALGGPFDRVVLLLADSFGWRFVQQYADYPALRRFAEDGLVRKASAQFPSTTAAHITTLHTGLEVGQHGVFEWQYYEPLVDAVIAPLMFSYAGTRTRDELKRQYIDPRPLLPARTLYHDLAPLGIRARVYQHREFTPSTYSDILFEGAQVVPYATLPEVLTELRLTLAQSDAPEYLVAYFGNLDTINHHHGPSVPYGEAETDAFLTSLERQFFAKLRGAGRTLVLVTADHGVIETDPKAAIYLNVDKRFAGIERYLRRDRQGRLLVPGGSPRDCFLYVQEGLVDEAQAFLVERLEGTAQVVRTSDLIADGFFGSQPPSAAFLGRVGDLVILPFGGECVWWYEKDRLEQRFYGHHGGLTRQEMEIPLLAVVVQAGSARPVRFRPKQSWGNLTGLDRILLLHDYHIPIASPERLRRVHLFCLGGRDDEAAGGGGASVVRILVHPGPERGGERLSALIAQVLVLVPRAPPPEVSARLRPVCLRLIRLRGQAAGGGERGVHGFQAGGQRVG